jgi:bacillithiol biosynthesis cysteine-adding enzyme BshC
MTGRFSAAYLEGGPRAALGWPSHFSRPADRAEAVARAAARPVAPEALEALTRPDDGAEVVAQRARLAQPGAAAVVTGQQVGLLLGPLYTLYKAASAVRVARALEAETGRPVVPVFWLQDEDHDFEEVAQAVLPRSGEPLRLALPPAPGQERVSLAHRRLGPGLDALLSALQAELGHLPHGPEVLRLITASHRPEASWSEAFRALLASLFAQEGLLILDPRHPALVGSAAHHAVHHLALTRAAALAEALVTRAAALTEAGFGAPVHIRPGAPLSFFHPAGPAGPRFRLEPGQGGLRCVGGEGAWPLTALLAHLESDPGRFTTSALLRPILQDSLLPTAAYVGGPGELDYFAQLPPLYAAAELPPPLLVPRARFRVLEEKTRRLLSELGLAPQDAEGPLEAALAKATSPGEWRPPAALQADLLGPFTAALAAARGSLEALDPGLAKNADRTEDAVRQAVGRLVEKYEATLARRDEGRVAAVARLKAQLHPDGAPQERVFAFATYAARHGARALVEAALAGCAPFEPGVKDILP